MSFKTFLKNLIIVVSFLYSFIGFTHGAYYHHDNKKWFLHESNTFIHGDFICSSNGMVTMRLANQSALVKYPIESFSMEDQLIIMERLALMEKFNHSRKASVKSGISQPKIFSESKARKSLFWFTLFLISILCFNRFSNHKKTAVVTALCSIVFLLIITCSKDEMSATPSTTSVSDAATNSDTMDNSSEDSATDNSTTANNNSDTTSESTNNTSDTSSDVDTTNSKTLIDLILDHFSDFSGVTITNDSEHFYINSYSWPEHGMGKGITSWQEQVPIPQNYTGDNSWTIPLYPKMSNTPLNTSEHLLKGALAVAVNGVPIFNVYNNRGENAYLIGELDDWGGHFGRGDDYHYHMIPTHLETIVGKEKPLAYALDGYPIYGYTEETLDEGFGRYDSDGNYRYHAVNRAPYYIPIMKGVVTLDPATTAPEDQIYPQPTQNPIRSSKDFKGVSGAVVNGLSQTGTNAFSFEYTVSGVKYYVNYSWDENCNFTYTYVDENGNSSNLPTNGAIPSDSSDNVETYNNVKFCTDVNLSNNESIGS